MRIFSYRNRRTARRTLKIVLCVAAALAALVIGRFLYLSRYITYAEDGVHLDYTQALSRTGQTQSAPNPEDFPFETIVQTGAVVTPDEDAASHKKLNGYYISTDMLLGGVAPVRAALREADEYNAVVLDVKSIYGNFYYSTSIAGAPTTDAIDVKEVDELIRQLTSNRKISVYARFPAFSDRRFALEHTSEGLPVSSGALWEGEDLCYWLSPTSPTVQGYLSTVAIELSQLGFDGVIFDDFYFPDSDRIVWRSSLSHDEAIAESANMIADSLHGYGIEICFETSNLAAAGYADRIALDIQNPERVAETLANYTEIFPNPEADVLVFTASRDTRYEACSILRPLIADGEE